MHSEWVLFILYNAIGSQKALEHSMFNQLPDANRINLWQLLTKKLLAMLGQVELKDKQ